MPQRAFGALREAASRSCRACARAGSPTAAPARRAARASTRPFASRAVTRVRVRPPAATFSTERWCAPDGRDLREVRHDEDLLPSRQGAQLPAHGFGGRPRHAGVHLVEDERPDGPPPARPARPAGPPSPPRRARPRARAGRARAPRRKRSSGAGAGAPRVRGERERHRVDAPGAEGDPFAARRERARGIRLPGDLHGERGPPEREVGEVRLDGLPEPRRRGGARLRELEGRAAEGGERLLRASSAFRTAPSRSAELLALLPERGPALDHLSERRAVLALELRERVEALGHPREARGIGLQLLEVAGCLERDLPHPLDRARPAARFGRRTRERFLRVNEEKSAPRRRRVRAPLSSVLQRARRPGRAAAPFSRRSPISSFQKKFFRPLPPRA